MLLRLRRRLGARGSAALLVLAAFLVTRALAIASTHAGAATMSEERRQGWSAASWRLRTETAPPLLEPLQRWDADYYTALAVRGYPPKEPGRPVYHLGFLPLYPLAVRAAAALTGNVFWAAFAVSHLCALLAALLLVELGAIRRRADGVRAAIFFLAAPGANFLSYPYSEPLFAFALAAGLLAARSGHLAAAALAGAAASGTRPAGLAVSVALASVPRPPRLMAALLATAGTMAFALWCGSQYGDALAFVHIQAEHHRVLSILGPFRALFGFDVDPDYYLVTLVCIAVAILMVRRTPAWAWLSAWFLLLLPLGTGTMKAMIRYQSTNLPLLCGVPTVLRGRWFWRAVLCSLALMCLEAALYGRGQAHY
jgi:hypothetical protein